MSYKYTDKKVSSTLFSAICTRISCRRASSKNLPSAEIRPYHPVHVQPPISPPPIGQLLQRQARTRRKASVGAPASTSTRSKARVRHWFWQRGQEVGREDGRERSPPTPKEEATDEGRKVLKHTAQNLQLYVVVYRISLEKTSKEADLKYLPRLKRWFLFRWCFVKASRDTCSSAFPSEHFRRSGSVVVSGDASASLGGWVFFELILNELWSAEQHASLYRSFSLCLLVTATALLGRPVHWRRCVMRQVYKDVDLRGMGDLLANSRLARSYAKSMYSNLSEQTLRPGRFHEQRAECLKAKVRACAIYMR